MERFWNKVKKGEADECWPWQAELYPNGYGRFSLNNHRTVAHRVAYSLTRGTIPDGLVVRHTCDNPQCCNPQHLLLGTQGDNMADKVNRNRQAKGSQCRHAKLTDEDVRHIRSMTGTLSEVAARFNVSIACISMVRARKTWAHVL